jgi:ATPase family associated with various cellular activities (AAA)
MTTTKQPKGINKVQEINSINILVVGDWVIDEDWVMTSERSETSAKQSDENHFHTAFDSLKVATKRLCGASLTASAIRGFLKKKEDSPEKKDQFNVFGMGVWHPDDDDYLEQLFQKDALEGANPFHICRPKIDPIEPGKRRLFNLARPGDICATTRIVRTFFGHQGTLPKSMSRYDWQLEWRGANEKQILKNEISKRVSQNLKRIKDMGVILDSVVIADFNKGLVDKNLILSLTAEIRKLDMTQEGINWFYRSKQLEIPDWHEEFSRKMSLKDKFIQFIDPRISKKFAEGKKLIYGKEITSEGFEFLHRYKPEHIRNPKMVVLFHNNSFIAHAEEEFHNCKDDDKSKRPDTWVLDSKAPPISLTRGRSSIFLASLVLLELQKNKRELIGIKRKNEIEYHFGANCRIALSNGIRWCNKCLSIWKEGGEKVLQVSYDIKEAIHFTDFCQNEDTAKPLNLKKVNKEWLAAKSKKNSCCIQKSSGDIYKDLCLEVWRAHTVLNDYTVLDDIRKDSVLNLTNNFQSFLELDDNDKKRPLISLVKASPGSGKTHLAKCLAKHFGMEIFECNVAQQTGLDGLTYFFDQVDIAQRDGRKIFMFLDEVDSLVNNESTFGFLLDIMWCGQYYRNGMKNTLKPFPGIFAMSRNPDDHLFKKDHPKYPDLITRIFGINCRLANFTPQESIYLFAKLLDKYFGKIANVEKGVLKTISDTELKYGPRSLELLISLFKGIKRSKITVDNLPNEDRIRELNEHFPIGLVKPSPYRTEDKQLVRIIYNAPTQ